MALLSVGPSSCFVNLLMQSGFNLAAEAGQASDSGDTSAMALSPPAWMYLPVLYSAFHKHGFDCFTLC